MSVLGRYDNLDALAEIAEVVLTVDERVVGTISPAANGHFHVKTKGLVPTIDGITGTSFNDVWSKVVDRIRVGGVHLIKPITDVSYPSGPNSQGQMRISNKSLQNRSTLPANKEKSSLEAAGNSAL